MQIGGNTVNIFLKILGFLILSFIFFGCSSELDEQANNYASHAIEALIDYANNEIEISSMDWICWESEFEDDGIIFVCSYYIEYKNERSEIDRFVQVIISESTYYQDIQETLNTLSTKKELEDSFNSSIDYAKE